MAGIAAQFNDWAFSNAEAEATAATIVLERSGRLEKSAIPDHGSTPEISSSGVRVQLTVSIGGTSTTDLRDNFALLMRNLRGTDRIKKGRLDLYGDGFYWCQLASTSPFSILEGVAQGSATLVFLSESPYRHSSSLISTTEAVTSSDPTFSIIYGASADFTGAVPRIPLTINVGASWQQAEIVRIENTTAGWIFEHEVTQNLTASQDLVIDGDNFEVLEAGAVVAEGISGEFPYLRGGVTNSFTMASSSRFNSPTIEFYDLFEA